MGNSASEILERMKSRLISPASLIEGSFTMDNLSSVSEEMARFYSYEYDRLISRVHLSSATGGDLDELGINDHGITRNGATYEEVNLMVEGIPGTVIDENIGAKSDDVIFMVTGTYEIGESGTIVVSARSTEAGSGKTVQSGSVTTFIEDYVGLTSVTNTTSSSGGYDEESDAAYRARILEYEKEQRGYGSISWYRKMAKEVQGVEKVKVFDLARGNGTVDVVIVAKGNKEASSVLIKRVEEHIESERLAGANVKVFTGVSLGIRVVCEVYLLDGYSVTNVKVAFKAKLGKYFEELDFSNASLNPRVSYAYIAGLLLDCEGVQDIRTLTINDSNVSLELDSRSFPIIENDIEMRKVGG